jgi:hypothetical protein
MRKLAYALAVVAVIGSGAAASGQDRPVTDKNPTVGEIVETPVEDLNLHNKKIPPVLIEASLRPYVLPHGCAAIGEAVTSLTKVLGPDIDKGTTSHGFSVGGAAKGAVGSLIPFEGLIREVSGAAEEQRALQSAVAAGIARRSFLKGYGQAKGCKAPARSEK